MSVLYKAPAWVLDSLSPGISRHSLFLSDFYIGKILLGAIGRLSIEKKKEMDIAGQLSIL
jgi:hypothetical protein